MKRAAQSSSTQIFTEIQDIRENIVLLHGNAACIIIRITSVNFALLSGQEQDSKVFAYAALLNSLSFPIQIFVRSKPLQIMPYISSIEEQAAKTQNQLLRTYMLKYKDFVTSLVQMTTVLDKQFYIVIPYSSLEGGISNVVKTTTKNQDYSEVFFEQAQASLQTKADSLLSQIHRLSLQAKILEKEELIKLFYDIYNQAGSFPLTSEDIAHPMVKGVS